MRLPRFFLFAVFILLLSPLRAQESAPVVMQALPEQPLAPGGDAVTIDLRNYFGVPGLPVSGWYAQFDTVLGRFNVWLRPDAAPQQAAKFLASADEGVFQRSIVHRAVPAAGNAAALIGGGAWRTPEGLAEVPRGAALPREYQLPNERGTLAAVRGADATIATNEWFINVTDNTGAFGPANSGGQTVFGQVLGAGMTVVDAIAALPRRAVNAALPEVPVRNSPTGAPGPDHYVVVESVRSATLFPTGGGASVIEFLVENSAPSTVGTFLSGSTLTVTPLAPGDATITVRAADSHGQSAVAQFRVSVPATPPQVLQQPVSQTVAAGNTVVFRAPVAAAATVRWERDGAPLPGANASTLMLERVTSAHAGSYRLVATNAFGTTTTASATLVVRDVPAEREGRLVNLSILTAAGSGARILTVGAVVGPFGGAGSLPLVVRAVGPSLAPPPFNVAGALTDPVLTLYAAGNPVPLAENDDWGGSPQLAAAFAAVGAFALPANSRDSALARIAPGVTSGGYTVQVSARDAAPGFVLAEIYDASGANRAPGAPRLINVSTLANLTAGSDLAVGFVIAGESARTVLVRGVGPSLAGLNVAGFMPDPRLELYNNDTQVRIDGNDDWGGALEVFAAGGQSGAFPLAGGTTKDAALLITLPPGAYSARVNGVGGAGGVAIVEVYEVR